MTEAFMYHKNSSSRSFLLPKKEGGAGIIDTPNLHKSQVKSLSTYFRNKKYLPLTSITRDTYISYTPLNVHDFVPQ